MKQTRENIDLTKGIIWKVMIRFALPIFLGAFFQSLYTMTDAVIVGRFAGKEGLAAIEAVLALTRLPLNFFVGLSSGASIIISQYYGAKKLDKVSSASHNAMLFAVSAGLLLSVVGVSLASFSVDITRVPLNVAVASKHYITIYFGGMVMLMIYNVGSGILRALGNSKTPFYFLIVANIVNIILDVLFIAVFRLGVIGAAIATVIASSVSAILILIILFKTSLPCRIKLHYIKFYREHLVEIIKLGLPIAIQGSLYSVANAIVQTSINKLGVDSISAWSIAGKMDFLIWNISSAFSFAISTFVAQNYGAKQYGRARQGSKVGMGMSVSFILSVSLFLYLFSMPLARILLPDENVIILNTKIIHFFVPFYFIYGVFEALSGAIRGSGDTFRPMMVNLVGICIFRIIWISYITPLKFELMMVLACYPASWIFTTFIFIILYFITFNNIHKKASII